MGSPEAYLISMESEHTNKKANTELTYEAYMSIPLAAYKVYHCSLVFVITSLNSHLAALVHS